MLYINLSSRLILQMLLLQQQGNISSVNCVSKCFETCTLTAITCRLSNRLIRQVSLQLGIGDSGVVFINREVACGLIRQVSVPVGDGDCRMFATWSRQLEVRRSVNNTTVYAVTSIEFLNGFDSYILLCKHSAISCRWNRYCWDMVHGVLQRYVWVSLQGGKIYGTHVCCSSLVGHS